MPDEIKYDEVVALVEAAGLFAYVEQTGGGCATIYAGPTREAVEAHRSHEMNDGCPVVLVGPGYFAGPGWTDARDSGETYVGADGDSDEVREGTWEAPEGATAEQVAEQVITRLRP